MFSKMISKIQAYRSSIDGATAIEYGLIAGGISLAIVAAVFAFGDDLNAVFNAIGNAMSSVVGRVQTG
jgi:pilus assembly protein Flp/PilA